MKAQMKLLMLFVGMMFTIVSCQPKEELALCPAGQDAEELALFYEKYNANILGGDNNANSRVEVAGWDCNIGFYDYDFTAYAGGDAELKVGETDVDVHYVIIKDFPASYSGVTKYEEYVVEMGYELDGYNMTQVEGIGYIKTLGAVSLGEPYGAWKFWTSAWTPWGNIAAINLTLPYFDMPTSNTYAGTDMKFYLWEKSCYESTGLVAPLYVETYEIAGQSCIDCHGG